ncbi:hypothetical protein [Herbiconiux solani]|uniref:hypothetical protein n=1 Tax=Herbiconiux solani TaxID=661329 RepID=UPI00082573A3|nr:hypothetical protein [Herbiconiux solani]
MTALTPDDLARIEELARRAVPGEWRIGELSDVFQARKRAQVELRAAVPALVAAVRSRDERIIELEAELRVAEDQANNNAADAIQAEARAAEAEAVVVALMEATSILGSTDAEMIQWIGTAFESTRSQEVLARVKAEAWWAGVTAQWEHRPIGNRVLESENPYRAGGDQ